MCRKKPNQLLGALHCGVDRFAGRGTSRAANLRGSRERASKLTERIEREGPAELEDDGESLQGEPCHQEDEGASGQLGAPVLIPRPAFGGTVLQLEERRPLGVRRILRCVNEEYNDTGDVETETDGRQKLRSHVTTRGTRRQLVVRIR